MEIRVLRKNDENELARTTVECKPEGMRSRGRPELIWMGEDLSKLGIKRWGMVARDNKLRRKISREPRLEQGCSAEDNDDFI